LARQQVASQVPMIDRQQNIRCDNKNIDEITKQTLHKCTTLKYFNLFTTSYKRNICNKKQPNTSFKTTM